MSKGFGDLIDAMECVMQSTAWQQETSMHERARMLAMTAADAVQEVYLPRSDVVVQALERARRNEKIRRARAQGLPVSVIAWRNEISERQVWRILQHG